MKQVHTKLQKKMSRLLLKWEESGMPLKTFSNTVDVSYYKLKYWKYKLERVNQKADSTNDGHVKKTIAPVKETPDFIPIEIPNTETGFTGIELSFPNNVKITFPSGTELDTLKTLIKLF